VAADLAISFGSQQPFQTVQLGFCLLEVLGSPLLFFGYVYMAGDVPIPRYVHTLWRGRTGKRNQTEACWCYFRREIQPGASGFVLY